MPNYCILHFQPLTGNVLTYKLILYSKNTSLKSSHFQTNKYFCRSVVSEMKFRLFDPDNSGGNLNNGKFLSQLNSYLASSGITLPEKQIYVEAKPGPRLAELIFLIILSTLSKLAYSHNAGEKS